MPITSAEEPEASEEVENAKDSPAPAGSPDRPAEPHDESAKTSRSTWSDAMQAWGALAAALIAALGLGAVGLGLIFQAASNAKQAEATRDQISINDLSRKSKEQEYASRVSWWLTKKADSQETLAQVQNRSNVPVRDVYLSLHIDVFMISSSHPEGEFTQLSPWILGPIIPPCSSISFDVASALPKVPTVLVNRVEVEYLYFTDVHDSWKVRSGAEPEKNDPNKLPQVSTATAMDGLTGTSPGGCG